MPHTPGPWFTDNNNIWHENGIACIAHLYSGVTNGESEEAVEANARLIAAAPELLEALTNTLNEYIDLVQSGDCGFWDGEDECHVKAARAAIAKATGDA